MSEDSQRPIIVKRKKAGHGGGHGGAWKIAYADFVTAMMAFFLLMWLLGSTSKATLEGIADYFKNPMKTANRGGEGAGDTTSVLHGGGLDMTKSTGQIKKGDSQKNKQAVSMAEVKRQIEKAKLKNLKDKLQKMVEGDAKLSQFRKQILIDITPEGLRIQIVDEKNRPMFDLGSAQLKSYTKEILHEIAKVLNEVPNRISLTGHTDATLYFGGEKGYSNWELSADRANASRRELIFGGMEEAKVLRVVGLASAVPFDKIDLFNPTNRRISIIVLNKLTEEALTAENSAAGSEEQPESQQSPTPPTSPTSPPAQEAPAAAPPPTVKGFPESVQKILKH
ncbi:MAG: flagellar motor protein MotB [Sulfuricellaceae bacterium]